MREATGDHEKAGSVPLELGEPTSRALATRRGGGVVRLLPGGGIAAARLALVARLERLADEARAELDGGLALPGLVVVFALGIALYFQLPREPWLPATLAVAVAAVATVVVRRRRGHVARVSAVFAALALGVLAATYETQRVAAPRLDHERTVTVEGRVVELDATARGGLRLTVDVARMEGRGLTAETTPARITATLSGRGWRPDAGDGVRFKARLKPPEGPVLPGGYDFARRAWFDGRGAGGYVLGRATPVDLGAPGWRDRWLAPIGSLRHLIADRVRASLPGASGAIGAALMVGEQRAIPDDVADALRTSGLTHIVSISGLHMSLVAGGVIVAVRGLLALFPLLVLGFPIKKWAAAAAFAAATIYLLLSGNQVAALRSHLMLSVALLAVMVDRPAITLHTVAVSAALILAVDPASALEPSFLMSYLAVIALVAAYDLHRARAKKRPPPAKDEGPIAHVIWSGLRHVEGLALSSLVAGLATAPVIAGVFFRGAPYSILANMVVLPVTGLVIMPAAVVAALAMPFGLDHWPLQVMGLGIDWMIQVGRWTAALPAGAGLIGASHPAAMGLGIVAVLWLSAWRGRIRLLGLVPALASLVLLFAGPRPDVMIGRHGTPVAVRDVDGRLRLLAGRQDRFDAGIWLAADGDGRLPGDGGLADGWRCDPLGCVFRLAAGEGAGPRAAEAASGGDSGSNAAALAASAVDDPIPGDDDLVIAVVRHPRGFAEDCRRATLVITTLVAPPGCRDLTTVIDRIDLARRGAATLRFIGPTVSPRDAHNTPSPAPTSVDTSFGATANVARQSPAPIDPTSEDGDDPSEAEPNAIAPSDIVPRAPRRAIEITQALPRFARPWTPVEPLIERIAREATEADAAARAAAGLSEVVVRPPRGERGNDGLIPNAGDRPTNADRPSNAGNRPNDGAARANVRSIVSSKNAARDIAVSPVPSVPLGDASATDPIGFEPPRGIPGEGEADVPASPAADQ